MNKIKELQDALASDCGFQKPRGSTMKTKVWFIPVHTGETQESAGEKAVKLADAAGLAKLVRKDALIGILQHVGEEDGIGHVKPQVTAALANRIAKLGGKPFLTGSSTLYRGRRSNAADHLMQAYDHGFTPDTIGCPIVMCDGLRGADKVDVEVSNARHCRTAHIGSAVPQMQGLVVVTHPTGHPAAGFGAAIKNVAMGLASRGGKLGMHHGSHPDFLEKRCTACGKCAEWCPENAIIIEKKAKLAPDRCVGCGQCFSVCPFDAIDFDWNVTGAVLQEKLVEYCAAVQALLGNSILYLNVIRHSKKAATASVIARKRFAMMSE
jgi:uncharacterized Fe-S center protein